MPQNKFFNLTDLLIIIFFLSVSISGFFYVSKSEPGKSVLILTPYGSYNYMLDRDRVLKVRGLLGDYVVEIKKGKVYVIETNCPKKICKKFKISKVNESITCVPNMINIKIEGNEEGEIDAITE